MPVKKEMHWEKSKKRWHRYYKGQMYRVTASALGGSTEEATLQAANTWWRAKKAELDGYILKNEAVAFVDSILDGPPEGDQAEAHEIADELMTGLVGVTTYKKAVEALEVGLARAAKIPERSVKVCGQAFLDVVRHTVKPRSYEELAAYIQTLNDHPFLGGDTDVGAIDEALVERMYLSIRDAKRSDGKDISPARRKKFWGFFKRFVAYVSEKKLIPTPGNLYSKTFKFKVPTQAVKEYEPAKVREVLKSLKSRLKLYALLGLNCGMTNVDIAELKKDMVDLKAGTLTRRRAKTGHIESTPTVTYKLWPELVKLLKKHQSSHPELFLTNMRGNPLCGTRVEEGKARRYDMIVQQWRRAAVKIDGKPLLLKAFRSISATWLEKDGVYGRYVSHFLGHSPRGIAAKHYSAPSQELFDQALTWLRGQVFG
ncbi:MAG: tyrosine-type recombinase/integrase [Gemmataceae bacterium]